MLRYSQGEPRSGEVPHGGQRQVKALHITSGILAFVLISGFMCAVPQVRAQSTCNYYASPTGTGNGLSQSTPFQISKFWAVAAPGKTLCLLDGTYTGDSSMIDPPDNLSGAPGRPITIKALNDGKVTINGQGKWRTVFLNRNNYFVLEGFNAHNSSDNSVVRVTRSQYNVVRRVVAWEAPDGNDAIVSVGDSQHTLFEDVAAWGIGRKVFAASQGGDFTTCRRCWGRWEGSHFMGPKLTYTLAYNNYNMIIENSIGTWSGEKMQQNYTLQCPAGQTNSRCGQSMTKGAVDQPEAIFGVDGVHPGKSTAIGSKILGSIAYITMKDQFPGSKLFWLVNVDAVEYTNNAAYIEPGSHQGKWPYVFQKSTVPNRGNSNIIAKDLTGIGGVSLFQNPFVSKSNIVEGATTALVPSIYKGPPGTHICMRYKDGVLTNEPLWPWPMNQRIKDAMIQSGRAPVDVTQTIENMFGPIPTECKTGIPSTAVVPKPRNLHIIGVR